MYVGIDMFFLELVRKEGKKVKLAGEVNVVMAGKAELVKLGDVKKDVFEKFTHNKLTINSSSGITSRCDGSSGQG